MTFVPNMLRGFAVRRDPLRQVDYRFVRDSVVRSYKAGRVSQIDVCDAHPELVRAARNVGEPTAETCPICGEGNVVLVSYAFGPGLSSSGRGVQTREELLKLRNRAGNAKLYVIEVCPLCTWNHLARIFSVEHVEQVD